MRKSLLLAAALAFTPSLAMAENITIEEPWTRASLSSAVKNAAVYMVIANDAETPDALLKMGVAFQDIGKDNLAKTTWEKLTRDFPDSGAAASAKKRLEGLN